MTAKTLRCRAFVVSSLVAGARKRGQTGHRVFCGFAASSVENNVDYFYAFRADSCFFSLVKAPPFLVASLNPYLSISIEMARGPTT
jgi:hypothetical protein